MTTMTIQIYLGEEWFDAATIDIRRLHSGIGGPAIFDYDLEYWMQKAATDDGPIVDERAVSVALPGNIEIADALAAIPRAIP